MPRFKVTLYTVAALSMDVYTEDEDEALDLANRRAREFSGQQHGGYDYTVALNDEWRLQDAEVTEL